MATKSTKKTNTRVSKKSRVASKGTGALRPHFKIWMGLLVVLIVALVGVVFVVRFSEAGTRPAVVRSSGTAPGSAVNPRIYVEVDNGNAWPKYETFWLEKRSTGNGRALWQHITNGGANLSCYSVFPSSQRGIKSAVLYHPYNLWGGGNTSSKPNSGDQIIIHWVSRDC